MGQRETEKKAKLFALLSDPNRLRILQFLYRSKRASVSEIASAIQMSVACTSHHLQLLKDSELLESTRKGVSIVYQVGQNPLLQKLKTFILHSLSP